MSGYIHYSGGTDETGRKIGRSLRYQFGNKMPNLLEHDIYVGWGCRLPKGWDSGTLEGRVAQGRLRVLNNPIRVSKNRNKLGTLERLSEAGVSVPGFVAREEGQSWSQFVSKVKEAMTTGWVAFPILGLTKGHRGTPFFCFTLEDIEPAIREAEEKENPLDYFRSFAPGTEVRVHVIRDEIILVQEKVPAGDPVASCVNNLKKKLDKKKEFEPHAPTLEWAVKVLSEDLLRGADRLQRSTARGWELTEVAPDAVPDRALSTAIDALEAAQLDLGAVSISIDGGDVRVTNITTGPTLNESQVEKYVSAIQDFAGKEATKETTKETKPKKGAKKSDKAKSELLSRVSQLLDGVSSSKAEKILKILQE